MRPNRNLRVRALTKLDSLQLGAAISFGSCGGEVPAKHKWTNDDRPYSVANEYICGELAHHIGLPIPPFAITTPSAQLGSVGPIFSTLDINFDGRDFSPVEPEYCVRALEDVCAGVLAFDVFIANSDRHDENVVVNDDLAPTELFLYDHDVALFGYHKNEGEQRLRTIDLLLKI